MIYQNFQALYSEDDDAKDWDTIIKVHTHLHATRDIRLKGAMLNMDSKTFERLHAPLRKAYQTQTNFKNVEGQVNNIVCINLPVHY
jgi:hypothetical protein